MKIGQQAYYLLKDISYNCDFIITDNIMPELTGYELIKKLREESNSIPIIMYSSWIDLEGELKDYDVTLVKKGNTNMLMYNIEKLVSEIEESRYMLRVENILDEKTNLKEFKEREIILQILRFVILQKCDIESSLKKVGQIRNVNSKKIVYEWLKPNDISFIKKIKYRNNISNILEKFIEENIIVDTVNK